MTKQWKGSAIEIERDKTDGTRWVEAPALELNDNDQKVYLLDEEGGVKESYRYANLMDFSVRLKHED